MPVTWDATKDQFLLLQLVADPDNKINKSTWEKVLSNWPANFGPAPTVRAVTEHVITLKKNQGGGGGNTPAPARAKTPKTPETTTGVIVKNEPGESTPAPHSVPPKGKGASASSKSPAKKRKREDDSDEESMAEDDDEDDNESAVAGA